MSVTGKNRVPGQCLALLPTVVNLGRYFCLVLETGLRCLSKFTAVDSRERDCSLVLNLHPHTFSGSRKD